MHVMGEQTVAKGGQCRKIRRVHLRIARDLPFKNNQILIWSSLREAGGRRLEFSHSPGPRLLSKIANSADTSAEAPIVDFVLRWISILVSDRRSIRVPC